MLSHHSEDDQNSLERSLSQLVAKRLRSFGLDSSMRPTLQDLALYIDVEMGRV